MKKQIFLSLSVIVLSTLSYYLPTLFIGNGKVLSGQVPREFYNLYVFKLAGAFFLNALYATIVFLILDTKKLILKLAFCWLMIAETFTLLTHLFDKLYKKELQNSHEMIGILLVFSCFCLFFLYRGISEPDSEEFNPAKSYLINKKPKTIAGIFSYLWNHTGHKSIYQDGKIYGFKRTTRKIEERIATYSFFQQKDISLKEIPAVKNIKELVGQQYHLFFFNCNHLLKYAR